MTDLRQACEDEKHRNKQKQKIERETDEGRTRCPRIKGIERRLRRAGGLITAFRLSDFARTTRMF